MAVTEKSIWIDGAFRHFYQSTPNTYNNLIKTETRLPTFRYLSLPTLRTERTLSTTNKPEDLHAG